MIPNPHPLALWPVIVLILTALASMLPAWRASQLTVRGVLVCSDEKDHKEIGDKL